MTKINVTQKLKSCLWKGRKHSGKERICLLPVFSLFPTMFSKGFLYRVVKTHNRVVKRLEGASIYLQEFLSKWKENNVNKSENKEIPVFFFLSRIF